MSAAAEVTSIIQTEPSDTLKPQGFVFSNNFVGNTGKNEYTPDKNKQQWKRQQPNQLFEEYISKEDAEAGIADGTLYRNIIRINPKNYKECFLDHPKGTAYSDVLIKDNERNRALQGDDVTVKLKPREEWILIPEVYNKWYFDTFQTERDIRKEITLGNEMANANVKHGDIPDECLIVRAAVVRINEERHCRVAAGKMMLMKNANYALLVPTDSKLPRVMIPKKDIDPEFFNRPQDFERFIYTAKITSWRAESTYANGHIIKMLGEAGNIEAETEKILLTNNIDYDEFPESVIATLNIQSEENFKIPDEQYNTRRDFRNEMVFTIDPKTARDLDDALSMKHIDDCDGKGTPGFEVGIHIADVTYFVQDNTLLDNWAEQRGNSTYLAQLVVPMLPRILCEQLCSLNPSVDRLAFSTVVKLDYQGEIHDRWFGRTIIRSCVKLAYEHAQDFIENPDKEFQREELPEITEGYNPEDIKQKVLMLHKMAIILRGKREEGGALRIEQPKLKFTIDQITKQPLGVSVYQIKDSNKLVEEYMLMANMEVAKKIESVYPTKAMLRCHPAPKQKMLENAINQCAEIGFPMSGKSSHELSTSMAKYNGNSLLRMCIRQVISTITIKPMTTAAYFCAGGVPDNYYFRHFALNVDRYTHFTSPIRRYPDMVVHRQLAAALGYCPLPERTAEELQAIARRCNDAKLASKTASEDSEALFFAAFMAVVNRIASKAVVIQVLDKAFDVIIVDYGIVKRIYVDKLGKVSTRHNPQQNSLQIGWPSDSDGDACSMTIKMCTVLDVELYSIDKLNYGAIIKKPTPEQRKVAENPLNVMFDKNLDYLETKTDKLAEKEE